MKLFDVIIITSVKSHSVTIDQQSTLFVPITPIIDILHERSVHTRIVVSSIIVLEGNKEQ